MHKIKSVDIDTDTWIRRDSEKAEAKKKPSEFYIPSKQGKVYYLDSFHVKRPLIDDVVSVSQAMKNVSLMVGVVSLLFLVITLLTSAVIIDPLIGGLLVVASSGFYLMSRVGCK